MKREARISCLSIILLCGIALHYMFITIILKDNIAIKFWKEILIIILLADTTILKYFIDRAKVYIGIIDIAIFLFCIALLWASMFMSDKFSVSIFVIRLYLIPLLIYYITKNNPKFTKKNVYKIIVTITIFYSILCIWGILQATILGDDFLINLGYPLKYEGRLRDSYYFGGVGDMQRVMATFANTNVFAAIIGILLIINLFNPSILKLNKRFKVIIVILFTAFILSFSRTNWVAMLVILVLLNWRNKKVIKGIGIAAIMMVILSILYSQITGINLFEVIIKYINDTITMTDPSAAGRSGIWQEAFEIFKANPFGIGLGHVGEVSTKLYGELLIPSESSYFAILLDTGLQGAICYFLIIFFMFYNTVQYKGNNIIIKQYLKSNRYILIYLLIIFISSNHIYDLEIMILIFFFIGLAGNKSFIKSMEE